MKQDSAVLVQTGADPDGLVLWFPLQEGGLRGARAVGPPSAGLLRQPLEPLVHRHALRDLH